MSNTGWGYFQQGSDQMQEVEAMGSKLSEVLDCPVHYPAFGKKLYECHCEIVFPAYMVKAAMDSGNWDDIKRKHSEGK